MQFTLKAAFSVAFISILCCLSTAQAQTRRALIVGINEYEQPKSQAKPGAAKRPATEVMEKPNRVARVSAPGVRHWTNLDGAVNDAEAMRQILVARFGFDPKNIRALKNSQATREAILRTFRQHLIDPASTGDVSFFFYAGHGSQVRNSKSEEPDRLDESIVPADSNRGAPDIRDKELARLYNRALDKGIVLTAILDSCHSGSVARGVPAIGKARNIDPDLNDVAEPPDPCPSDKCAPEERGALILSAAQDYQRAMEATDEADPQGAKHGAFSLALMQALRQAPVNEPAQQIFQRARALMQTNGQTQEPVVAGTRERRAQSLFGASTVPLSNGARVAVARIDRYDRVILQGGRAAGLNKGCELVKVEAESKNNPARLRITEVSGLSNSVAEVIGKDAAGIAKTLKPGDLFEADRWAAPDEAMLRVWLPATLPANEISRVAQAIAPLRDSDKLRWVDDPTQEAPSHLMYWEANGWKLWNVSQPKDRAVNLGASPSAQSALAQLSSSEKPSFFLYLPPSGELAKSLAFGPNTRNSAIEIAASPDQAQYLLVGRASDKGVEYAWVRPQITWAKPPQADNAPAAPHEGSTLPERTDWIAAVSARKLEELALRLGVIRSWLRLAAPPAEGNFPYRLALTDGVTGEVLTKADEKTGEIVTEPAQQGRTYGLALIADEAALKGGVAPRYVYVFSIDRNGTGNLLFPRIESGNVENRLPLENKTNSGSRWPIRIQLGSKALFGIGPPYGVDTYILLASNEPIDPTVLQFDGVVSRGGSNELTPLGRLLQQVGKAQRGTPPIVPTNWSIERLPVLSVEKK